MNNVSVRLVFDRKHVATKKRQSSVQMEVTYQRKRKYVGTGIKLYSDQWGKDLKVKNHPQSLVFNQKLNDMVSGIYDFVYQLSSQNIPFTFERLERYLNNSESGTTNSFLSFMEKRIYERQVTDSTKQRQKCVLKALKEFGRIKDFTDICDENIRAYDEFAKKRCKCQSSVYNYPQDTESICKRGIRGSFDFRESISEFQIRSRQTCSKKVFDERRTG